MGSLSSLTAAQFLAAWAKDSMLAAWRFPLFGARRHGSTGPRRGEALRVAPHLRTAGTAGSPKSKRYTRHLGTK